MQLPGFLLLSTPRPRVVEVAVTPVELVAIRQASHRQTAGTLSHQGCVEEVRVILGTHRCLVAAIASARGQEIELVADWAAGRD